ncbi:hypothetical protein ACKAV7_012318 [Fusarium commune]
MSSTPAKRQKVDGEKDTPTTPDFESFVPDGDVVFIVNRDTRVRVHFIVMKGDSPVFAAMLGPNFMEGQALATANANTETDPFETALPEEESSICFGWICRALHCQSATMLWNTTSLEIVKVWSIIDNGLQDTRSLVFGPVLNLEFKLAPRPTAKLQVVRTDAQNKVAGLVYNEPPSIIASSNCSTETTDYFDDLPDIMYRDGLPIFFLDIGAPLDHVD